MAQIKLYLFALLLATAALPSFGFRLANSSSYRRHLSELDRPKGVEPELVRQEEEQIDEPEPLYKALVHLDGRPTEVLVDRLGDPEDLKYQTGDPVASAYPFIGALGTIKWVGRSFYYSIHCTSSLIDSQSVLTAGHCISPKEKGVNDIFVHGLSDIRVNGRNYYEKKDNLAEIESFTVHTQYSKDPQIVYDIAIGHLKEPLTRSNSKTKPVCLGSTDKYSSGIVGAGWGYKNCQNEASTETLRKARSTIVNPEECKRIYARISRQQILDQHICTFFKLDNGEPAASASGDSGGPLFSYADPNNPVQVGLTSFSIKMEREGPLAYCTRKDVPMVFARVSFFKDFVDKLAPNVQWC